MQILFPKRVIIKEIIIRIHIYSVYKKLYPLKCKLSARYCFNLTALTASKLIIRKKQKVLYILEINNNVIHQRETAINVGAVKS